MMTRFLFALITCTALTACDIASPNATVGVNGNAGALGSPNTGNPPGNSANPTPCLDPSCAIKTEHLHIFDAENSVFSSDGRLFVSGGSDVYEITKDNAGNLQSTIISTVTCNYTGLTIRGSTLYAACFDNGLYATDLSAPALTQIYTITGTQSANGLAHIGDHLYVTNGPISSPLEPRVHQLLIDGSNPMNIVSQAAWTTVGELISANGLQVVNGEIWVTDTNQIIRYAVDSAGNKGASSTVLTHTTLAFDDFTVLDDGNIAVTDMANAVHLFDPAGSLLESTTNVAGPSSAIQGRAPMFNPWDIIVTEKGTLGDNTAGNGNRLAIFTAN